MPADDTAPAVSRPQRLVLALLRGYQLTFSPMFAGSCRFLPSCSAYAVEAVTRFGVLRGGLMAARRLARCRPGAAHGFDPVPDVDGAAPARAIGADQHGPGCCHD